MQRNNTLLNKFFSYVPGTEGYEVKQFLDHSTEIKKMNEIAVKHSKHPEQATMLKMTKEINLADNFDTILQTLERFDYKNTNDPTVKKLGQSGMNILFFIGGYVSPEANFAYYAGHLREKCVEHMKKSGYSPQQFSKKNN